MYLPSKITKILYNINKPYIVYYTEGKITSVSIYNDNVNIKPCNQGYCIYINGYSVVVNNLKLVEPLLIKFNVLNSKEKMKNNLKVTKSLVDIFIENEKSFAIEYFKDRVVSIILDEPKLYISKTSIGYMIKINNEDIAVDSLSDMKKLLIKINAIKDKSSKNKVNDELEFEQLRLDI